MEHADTKCILCRSTERTLLIRQGEWTVYKCENCGLGLLDPRPDPMERIRLYQDGYFQSHYDRGLKVDSPEMKRRLSQETHRLKFFRKIKKRGRILDVGCGMGYFLYACRLAGYETQGLDISDHSTAYVRDELRIPIVTGAIEEIRMEEGTMDIVTMWHFLEHSPDPEQYLEKARRWLKPDGILVVDVPNHEGTDARKMGESWTGWSIPYHLYHFTPSTLLSLLTRYGFHAIRMKSYHSEYVKEKLNRIPVVNLVARPIAKFFSGHSVAVLACKE
jgi:2-polyprenyl-3-methyl-5-hydroxy-6-metoxy-1,4-benzoquinol methylase